MEPATRFAAHRGGAALWPENSLLAFSNAIALGADFIEFDVHATADGDVAVIHDAMLERTTDGVGRVSAYRAATLRQRRLRGPAGELTDERIPMLDDVLALVREHPVGVLLEIKGLRRGRRALALERRIVRALDEAALLDRVVVMAFDGRAVAHVRQLAPSLRTALLVARRPMRRRRARHTAIAKAVRLGATDVSFDYTLIDAATVQAAHAAGLGVGAWTVNAEGDMRRLADLGVDILTTDRPDVAKRVLGR